MNPNTMMALDLNLRETKLLLDDAKDDEMMELPRIQVRRTAATAKAAADAVAAAVAAVAANGGDDAFASLYNIEFLSKNNLDLQTLIAEYLDGESLARGAATCSGMKLVFCQDLLWRDLCVQRNWSQRSQTRTRGVRLWKHVYVSHLCVTCFGYDERGTVMIDLEGGSMHETKRALPVCASCFGQVQQYDSLTDRKKHCLQKLKKREQHKSAIHMLILNKIPKLKAGTKKAKRGEAKVEGGFDNAGHNDYLLKKVKRGKKGK